MKLGEKIRYLREVEGSLRGMGRAINQQELVRLIEAETGGKLSQSYLSQIESGARPHLTNTTRQTLAGFFKVHPGYLVDDPEGYHPELQSELRGQPEVEEKIDLWLVSGAERFRRDAVLKHALLTLARHERTRDCLLLLEAILETPGLMPRLLEVLRPSALEVAEEEEAETAAEALPAGATPGRGTLRNAAAKKATPKTAVLKKATPDKASFEKTGRVKTGQEKTGQGIKTQAAGARKAQPKRRKVVER